MRIPVATYRLQFNRGFRFTDARDLVPYLASLGITDLYASPLLQARQGSTHGYDVTDPMRLNPEIGAAEDFDLLVEQLRRFGMGLLLDIVPNHMAASSDNPWWVDVLENGLHSVYASFFDVDWSGATQAREEKIPLPLLGRPYGSVLENQELLPGLDEEGLHVRYAGMRLPLEPGSYRAILSHRIRTLEQGLGTAHPAFRGLVELLDAIQRLPGGTAASPERLEERHREKERIKHRLWQLYVTHLEIKRFLDENLRIFAGAKGDPSSFERLDALLAKQPYRLGFWRVVREQTNYRRFFDVSDLICLRVEDSAVFEAGHALILALAKGEKVTGLRVDHVDGLLDPLGYLRRLQNRIAGAPDGEAAPPRFYVVAEKILVGDEALPADWPVCGTTGYEFARAVNGVFVDRGGMTRLDAITAAFTGASAAFSKIVYEAKKRVVAELFSAELGLLGQLLARLALSDRHAHDLPLQGLSRALVEVTACLRVYRTTVRDFAVSSRDRAAIAAAIVEAHRRAGDLGRAPVAFLKRVLLLDFPGSLPPAAQVEWLRFVRRWQQFTGPVMAKGLEDTALYRYSRLLSLNEVGGDPTGERCSVEDFHRHNRATRARWPQTLNATSTHDTKRSEDVRARINVLSELPAAWGERLKRWSRWNRSKRRRIDGRPVPDRSEEISLYQTLIGAWPLSPKEVPAVRARLDAYVVKAAREAKVRTGWIHPDREHERALVAFVRALLRRAKTNRFLRDFLQFQGAVAFYGACNALAQVLCKIASPGVPDFYQGTELWAFSLVDPDNRRPVDFEKRIRLLAELERREKAGALDLAADLLARWRDGRIKLFVTWKALTFRRRHAALFQEGAYLPLVASGKRKAHVCAFARRHGDAWALAAVPRLLTGVVKPEMPPCGGRVWGSDRLLLPATAPARWRNVFTGETVQARTVRGKRVLLVGSVFQHFPVALLSGVPA